MSEIARAVMGSFTANCGHVVHDGAEYVVKRPGVFYCSPACAALDPSEEITVRLKRGREALDELRHGVFACILWLEDNGDGTFGIVAGGAAVVDEESEAYLRVLLERSAEFDGAPERWPPITTDEPSEQVKLAMDRLRIRLGWNGTTAE